MGFPGDTFLIRRITCGDDVMFCCLKFLESLQIHASELAVKEDVIFQEIISPVIHPNRETLAFGQIVDFGAV